MAACRRALALALLAVAAECLIAGQGGAQDVRCQKDELMRQVRVQLAQDADGLPCQVIWRDAAGAVGDQLVWRNDTQLEFCTHKARELVNQLVDEGWTCDAQVSASSARSAPRTSVRLEPILPDADAALRLEPETGRPQPTAPPAQRTRETKAQPDRAVLHAALARDIGRLDRLAARSGGGFEVTTARLGDLNDDGIADAVALLTHRADGAPTYHLLAYVFDGQTFRPVARLSLTEAHGGFTRAELEGIVDGVIEVLLHVPQRGDPQCCPSGRRRASFVLRHQQLVKAGKSRPGASGGQCRPASVSARRRTVAARGRRRQHGRPIGNSPAA